MSTKFQYQPKSFHLQWHITERCNLRCKHCYMEQDFLKNELSLEKLFKVLDDYLKIVRKWRIPKQETRISITGGEPLIRKDFFKFLERCYQYKDLTKYGILTNGILVDDEMVKRFNNLEVNYVQVSLEGMEADNDYIRGKGTFKKIIKAVEILVKGGINVSISVTMTKKNKEDVKPLVELAKKLGVTSLGLRRFVPIGTGEGIKDLMLSAQDVKRLYLYITEENKELFKNKSKLKIGMGCEDGILAQEGYPVNGCVAGYSSVTILPNGDVYPCRKLPIYIGNVLGQSLEDIFYNPKEMQKLRNPNNLNGKFKNCPYSDKCRGGAKCVIYGYWSDSYIDSPQFLPDPECWRLFN